MKVSKKDIKLLLVLASVILLAGSYYFGYVKYNEKRTVLEDEIVTLQKKYDNLYVKDLKRADYEAEVKTFTNKIKEISNKYPSEVTTEKEIMFADEVEHYANAVISTWSFAEPEIFYASKDLVAETETVNTTDKNKDSTGNSGSNNESSESTAEPTKNSDAKSTKKSTGSSLTSTVMGFKTVTTYGFKVGYDGLKNMITYINNSPKRKVLDNIMITYDGVSGELTGTLSINNYFVSGALATYEPPIITDINLGTSNLFGDMIPVKPDENNGEQKTNNQNTNSQKTNDANGGQEQSPAPTAEQ